VPSSGCPENYSPVCGANGGTYGNAYEAMRAQTSVVHEGPCESGEGMNCDPRDMNGACGDSGRLYCRDTCPFCDDSIFRCTQNGACVLDLDCPAGLPLPPVACPNGQTWVLQCVNHACRYSCQ
jgi:hypothetical protein